MMNDKGFSSEPVCPVCSSANQLSCLYPMRTNIDGDLHVTYWLYRCKTCGAGLTFPRPNKDSLAQFYRDGTYTKGGGRASFVVKRVLDYLQDTRLSEIEQLCKSTGNLLDIGCGKGRFLGRAVLRGWNAQGVETSPGQVAIAQELYQVRVFQGELLERDFANRSFQVVTAWHVLEHLPDPSPMLNEVYRILQPHGWLVLEVPNLDSWQARIGQEGWFQLDAPRHLVHYSRITLQRLLEEHGFSPIKYETFSLELGPFGMLQSLLNRMGLPPNWLFRWLKRSASEKQVITLFLNLLGALLLFAPATALEVFSSLTKKHGGVMRVFAKKIDS